MNNVIYVNKKENMTSFDVCFKLRKVFNTRSIGHTGTLDPMATGVMIVLVDKATKASQFLSGLDKEYLGLVKLGYMTDTLDKDGEVIKEEEFKTIDKNKLESVIKSFNKTYIQEPPLTSAIKVKGKKLYEYQRQNIPVMIPKREVTIYNFELLSCNDDSFTFKAKVSSGTYIRALIRDVLNEYGTIGTLESLKRTAVGNVSIEMCEDFDEIMKGNYRGHDLYEVLSPLYEVIEYPNEADIKNGKRIKIDTLSEKVLIVNDKKEVLAIYARDDYGLYRSLRGLF